MQFNSHATNDDIVSDIKFWITGSATGTISFAINDITRGVNQWYDKVATLIMRCDNRWEWDDDNFDTLPIATTNLVNGQADYAIDSADFLDIIRLEIKDQNGNGQFLYPISYEDRKGVAMTEWAKTDATPTTYDKVGNSIILYPTPNYNSTSGLKVYFKRNPSYFAATDTTKVPGFVKQFHRLLSMGPAYDYCIVNGLERKQATLEKEITKMQSDLIDYYSSRSKDDRPKMRLASENYSAGYEYPVSEDKLYW